MTDKWNDVLEMRFRVYVGKYGKSQYFNVFIFRTRKLMTEFHREQTHVVNPSLKKIFPRKPFLATANWWEPDPGSRCCGQVLFFTDFTGGGVVSHEMTHAALYWCMRNIKKFDPMKKKAHDERFAGLQGELVRQFWNRWYVRKGSKRRHV